MQDSSKLSEIEPSFNPKLKNTARLSWQSKPRDQPTAQNLEFQLAEVIVRESGEAKFSDYVSGSQESTIWRTNGEDTSELSEP